MVRILFITLLLFVPEALHASSTEVASEQDYYPISTVTPPDAIKLEVSGIAVLSTNEVAVVNRRGELWRIQNPDSTPNFKLFASGLHEPLGLAWRSNAFYVVQRSELTRIVDNDNDGIADEYQTFAKGWGVTGNYHEYAYGPKFDSAGNAWITLNSTLGKRLVDDFAWRGWGLRVEPDGSWTPISGGMRSPSGLGVNHLDDAFFTDQQGNWVATCSLSHMRTGAFHGHADALKTMSGPVPGFVKPGPLPEDLLLPEAARKVPGLALPAVWFPYRKMGMSATDVTLDNTAGRFGPFTNQLFVGEFVQSRILRVFLEKVGGEYQGACFPFREGFQCGVLRIEFGPDGSMWVGQSNRGWNSFGSRSYGLQRVAWIGTTPFEIATMHALPTGFLLRFTEPVAHESAEDLRTWKLSSYTYEYHSTYGSPEMNTKNVTLSAVNISPDGFEVRLETRGLREGYVHELRAPALRSSSGRQLLHSEAYYTLNRIPRSP